MSANESEVNTNAVNVSSLLKRSSHSWSQHLKNTMTLLLLSLVMMMWITATIQRDMGSASDSVTTSAASTPAVGEAEKILTEETCSVSDKSVIPRESRVTNPRIPNATNDYFLDTNCGVMQVSSGTYTAVETGEKYVFTVQSQEGNVLKAQINEINPRNTDRMG